MQNELGASHDTPSPLCTRVSTPASPWVAARVRQRIEQAFLQPSRPAHCNSPCTATRIRPCPGLWWGGREPLSLSE